MFCFSERRLPTVVKVQMNRCSEVIRGYPLLIPPWAFLSVSVSSHKNGYLTRFGGRSWRVLLEDIALIFTSERVGSD